MATSITDKKESKLGKEIKEHILSLLIRSY